MKIEITQEHLQKIIGIMNALAQTNLYTPLSYSNEIVPFISELQGLSTIQARAQKEEDVASDIVPPVT